MQTKNLRGLRKLTRKQRSFLDTYLSNGCNAAAAYRAAYRSKASAKRVADEASRLLQHPGIAPVLRSAEQRRSAVTAAVMDRYELDGKRIAERLARLAVFDIREVVSWDAKSVTLKASDEISDDVAFAIAEIRMTEHGPVVKLHDKRQALMDLAKLKGEIIDRKEISGVGGKPIETEEASPKAFGRDIMERAFLEIARRRRGEAPSGQPN